MRAPGRAACVTLMLGLATWGCAGPGLPEEAPDHPRIATSTAGMVVSGSPYATEAGARMLARGGNAVDAAVAAAFALAVAEPTQSGLGGRTQLLGVSRGGAAFGIDGTNEVPAGYDPDTAVQGEQGHTAVAVPGTVAALTRALAEHGTLPLETVVGPALAWARSGVHLTPTEAGRIAGVAPMLDPASEAARIFLRPDGTPREQGELLVQPDLARVLEAIAQGGADVFYRGWIAEAIAADMAANGGYIGLQDLAAYRAVDARIGRGSFGDVELVGTYLPAAGVTVTEVVRILDRFDLAGADEPRWAALVAEALVAGFEDRETAEALPPTEAVAWLVSDSLADRRAAEIARGAGPARAASAPGAARPEPAESPFTTHVSVADTFGAVVALTQSLGPTMGARVATPGLGFLYASTLGGYLLGGGPGYRPWSSQAPLVALRDGRPYLVLGGAGARRIVSALVTTLVRVVGQGVPLTDALDTPRLHFTSGEIRVEEGWGLEGPLEALGYHPSLRDPSYFARLNVVEVTGAGTFLGVGEPRWASSAAAGPPR